mmetsp:Transcript_44777/g.71554  ORF Transcript_44777/g.71554 Transcript_44777/m.71554 type:complete len:575 (+) Transcript_44777:96-1820(+)
MRFVDFFCILQWMAACCAGAKAPHIVLILADDFGWNDVGYHQGKVSSANPNGEPTTNAIVETPTLDLLASQGVKLESYYVQPLCSPSRGSLMNGKFPCTTGFGPDVHGASHGPSSPFGLPAKDILIPQMLGKLGYSSHMVGKWHLGHCDARYTPTGRGFKSWTGYLTGAEGYNVPSIVGDANMSGSTKIHMNGIDMRSGDAPADPTVDVPPVYHMPEEVDKDDCHSPNSTACYSTIFFTQKTIEVIERFQKTTLDENERLFLYVAYQATHNPLASPDIYRRPYDDKISDYPRRLFAGMAAALDEGVRNITLALKKSGLWDETVLIFSTDNGGEPSQIGRGNNYPLRGGKVTNWEGGVRGVAFIRGTNDPTFAPLPKNETRMNLMHITDWFPTLYGLAKSGEKQQYISVNENTLDELDVDGVDQWQAIAGKKPSPRKIIWHNIQPDEDFNPRLPSDAIRVGDWKLFARTHSSAGVVPPPGFKNNHTTNPRPYKRSYFLFHIPTDPTETNNLATSHPKKLAEMLGIYRQQQHKVRADLNIKWAWSDPAANPALRLDKGWGPFNGTHSTCAYNKEYD